MKLNLVGLFLLFAISMAFSQEAPGPIKFQIPANLDTSQLLKPDIVAQDKPQNVPQNQPLNLSALTAKDSENFEEYSRRYTLIQDSISAIHKSIEEVKKKAEAELPPLAPKDEFEKQAQYDARALKWNAELSAHMEKDTKAFKARLAELEKAKAKILENQAAFYASVEMKSEPPAALWINGEAMKTPIEYKSIMPGTVKISLQKEGYSTWDTTLQIAPKAKLKLYVVLEEKSIFSSENEINFSKILSKDTTVLGYEHRIKKINERQAEVDKEIKQILEDFPKKYPALEPQKDGETPEAFGKRQDEWKKEGMWQFAELQRKHEDYSKKLNSSITVLNDYIIAAQSSLLSETAATAKINLGVYDSEGETYEFVAQDTANKKSPFYFNGKVGVPMDAAKSLDRNAPGFITSLQFINFPFNTDSASVNLAMSGLQFSMNGQDLKVNGSFGEIEHYKSMEGYPAWKLRADSLLSGKLKARGLDYTYVINEAVKEVAKSESEIKSKSGETGGLGWRGITRIVAFSATALLGAASIYKHLGVEKGYKELDDLKTPSGDIDKWKEQYNAKTDEIRENENHRNIFGAAAGVCAVSGVITFFF